MKRGASERYVLDEEQVSNLLNQATEPDDRAALELMVYLGMRISEVCHLNHTWIHEDTREIHIPPSQKCLCNECMKHKAYPGEWRPKSEASARSLPIPDLISRNLHEFLCLKPGGLRITRQALWWKVKQWAKAAKIKVRGLSEDTIYPHVLRATAATRLATKGVSAPALCYIMGWANLEVGAHYISIAKAKAEAHKQMREMLR